MSEASRRLRILLLCDEWSGHANTIKDHINAFRHLSRHDVRTFNPIGMRDSVALDLDQFDVVVIHYSVILCHENHVSPAFRAKLRRYQGLKVQFIQDEYRWVEQVTAAARDAGINVLFTLVEEPAASQIYDSRLPGVRRVYTQTGYVPDNLVNRARRPLRDRTIEVGYRGRDIPWWLGSLSQEKILVGQGFLERSARYGLEVDIGWRESDRIYGDRWIEFIESCRATLCSESGASITDFDGSAERAVEAYLKEHPGAPFEEVHAAVLQPFEGNVPMPVISPRVFEAAALGTALIMFPGHYSGVVQPDEDYILLEKDFSNMDDVVRKLRDDAYVSALTERASNHLVKSRRWSFEAFARQFDDVVEEEVRVPRPRRVAPGYRLARVERALRVPPPHVRMVRGALGLISRTTGRQVTVRRDVESGAFLIKGGMALRAAVGDSTLRPILREGQRAGLSMVAIVDELFELSLLIRASRGRLATREDFALTSRFDASDGSLRFTSEPPGQQHPANGSASLARAALLSGGLNHIEWDHTAFGGTVTLTRPEIEVGIGDHGLSHYDLVVAIGRRRPQLLERALAPMLGPHDR